MRGRKTRLRGPRAAGRRCRSPGRSFGRLRNTACFVSSFKMFEMFENKNAKKLRKKGDDKKKERLCKLPWLAWQKGRRPFLLLFTYLEGTQTGLYQTGSYQKGRFTPQKPKSLYNMLFVDFICCFYVILFICCLLCYLLFIFLWIRPRLYASEYLEDSACGRSACRFHCC